MSKRSHTMPPVGSDQRGAALVIALLVLLALSVLGAALISNVQIEDKITSFQRRDTEALHIAEAGLQEAMLRLRNGEIPDNGNKRMVSIIYEAPAGSIPVSGADTTSLPTLQPSGRYLGYSSASKKYAQGSTTDLQNLTVKYKTKITPGAPPDTQIVLYDDSATPKMNTTSGTPVFIVTATGTKGKIARRLVAEVTRAKFTVMSRGAVAAKVSIELKGNIKICGHDHLYATPYGKQPPGCNGFPSGAPPGWWAPGVHADCMPGGWSESTVNQVGSPTVIGEPTSYEQNQTGFYSGPWDALTLTQAEFWPWIGNAVSVPPMPPKGVYYLDNNGVKQDQSGVFAYTGGDGEGLLYVDGDLSINGTFRYKGMIYVEGDLAINGDAWILGGIIVRGQQPVKVANGSAVILYSSEAIEQAISKYGGDMRMLSWREF
jgi:Tfp pilus assembly protein PilX